jgi:signal transduction histidine kinase/ABC-type multidrug transport system ATPase subunit
MVATPVRLEHPLYDLPDIRETPLLAVRGVSVSFGRLQVLDNVDLDVYPGQLVALAGENGAGKSTLVRCIAGDMSPSRGEIRIDGRPVRSNAEAATNGLAVVWQDLALCDNLDIASNLFLGREKKAWFLSGAKAQQEAARLLGELGISIPDASRSVRSLSGGQRQLVAVARAMQSRPKLLILDEPTASLGVQESRQVQELIHELRRQGTTIVLVSHSVEQIFELADRVLILRGGRVVADVGPNETHPDDVIAIMSGNEPDATARRQISRLQGLVDQLASATPSSVLSLIVSALSAALRIDQLCVHLLDGDRLVCAAAVGLPAQLLAAWSVVPLGVDGGPMGLAAAGQHIVVDEDLDRSEAWRRFAGAAFDSGARSAWAVPIVGTSGLVGVITGCQATTGRPHRDHLDLVSLYAAYAAGAIERDRLLGQVTARNRILETIREVLETLAGPGLIATGLLMAMQSLHLGLRAEELELWVHPSAGPLHCRAFVDEDGEAHDRPEYRDRTEAELGERSVEDKGHARLVAGEASVRVIVVPFDVPDGTAVLVARWSITPIPEDAAALLEDAAHSLRLALEREEAEQAHQEADALRRSHELQRDFLSRLSHELRTPLTAIRGYATSLLAPDVTWDDESKARFLNRIASESSRLGRLVGDLLDFSAIESGIMRLQQDWCDLPLVLEAAVSVLPPTKAKAVRVEWAEGLSPVWADHDRMEQVFVNLLENALRHNPAGTTVLVTLDVDPPGYVRVRVRDDGVGIPSELADHVFEPRERGNSRAPGAGLGLAIARGIVVAHGGTIGLESAEAGTTFIVHLPIEEAPDGSE